MDVTLETEVVDDGAFPALELEPLPPPTGVETDEELGAVPWVHCQ